MKTRCPDADERFRQARIVTDSFIGFGYQPVGIDHFALPDDDLAIAAREGTLNRNFQGYTNDRCGTPDRVWPVIDLAVSGRLCAEYFRCRAISQARGSRRAGDGSRLTRCVTQTVSAPPSSPRSCAISASI